MTDRSYEPELMDDPQCDQKKLVRTVKQFKLINRLFSRSHSLLKKLCLADMTDPVKTYRFLDIGAGGADLAIWLAKQCRKKEIQIEIVCLDYDPIIAAFARRAVADFPEISVVEGSAFDLEPLGTFDFVFTNHFLHHLTFDQIRIVIAQIDLVCTKRSILNDLKRSSMGYLGYSLVAGLFFRNSFAFYDGRLSILRGFTERELQTEILDQLPQLALSISIIAPARIVLIGTH